MGCAFGALCVIFILSASCIPYPKQSQALWGTGMGVFMSLMSVFLLAGVLSPLCVINPFVVEDNDFILFKYSQLSEKVARNKCFGGGDKFIKNPFGTAGVFIIVSFFIWMLAGCCVCCNLHLRPLEPECSFPVVPDVIAPVVQDLESDAIEQEYEEIDHIPHCSAPIEEIPMAQAVVAEEEPAMDKGKRYYQH